MRRGLVSVLAALAFLGSAGGALAQRTTGNFERLFDKTMRKAAA